MKASQVIAKLQQLKDKYGDHDVEISAPLIGREPDYSISAVECLLEHYSAAELRYTHNADVFFVS